MIFSNRKVEFCSRKCFALAVSASALLSLPSLAGPQLKPVLKAIDPSQAKVDTNSETAPPPPPGAYSTPPVPMAGSGAPLSPQQNNYGAPYTAPDRSRSAFAGAPNTVPSAYPSPNAPYPPGSAPPLTVRPAMPGHYLTPSSYGQPDSYSAPGAYIPQSNYPPPYSYAPQNSYSPPGANAPQNSYPPPNSYVSPSNYPPPGAYGQPGYYAATPPAFPQTQLYGIPPAYQGPASRGGGYGAPAQGYPARSYAPAVPSTGQSAPPSWGQGYTTPGGQSSAGAAPAFPADNMIPEFGKPLPTPAQAEPSTPEQVVASLEQMEFGSSYPEHEVEDRIDHLEREVFGKVSVGESTENRLAKLQAKLRAGAFGRTGNASGR